jgi:hypothetical protein
VSGIVVGQLANRTKLVRFQAPARRMIRRNSRETSRGEHSKRRER